MSTSAMSTRRTTRSSAKADESAAPIAAFVEPVKAKRVTKKKAAAPLADVTNTANGMTDIVVASSEPIKPTTTISMQWDVDALTAEKDVEPVVEAEVVPAVVAPTTVVPAQPQLLCAEIDPSILALKVVRPAPIPSFASMNSAAARDQDEDSDNEEIVPSSRRVQFIYAENGEMIGQQDVTPINSNFGSSVDADEEDEEDLRELGEVERMTLPLDEEFIAPAPLELDHAKPISAAQVNSGYSSGFLPSGVLSTSTVRSVKLDSFDSDATLPSFLFAAPASTEVNLPKVTGFIQHIDPTRISSKKL